MHVEGIEKVDLILRRLDALPTLSPVATRLLSVAAAADADLREIAKLIESDPALTAKVLALCRRAHLGLGSRVTTVRQAVTMLGLEAVQAAVLSVEVYEVISAEASRDGGSPCGVDNRGLWRHSIAVACAAELLAGANPGLGTSPDEAFVCGLLHDVGKFALAVILPRAFERVVAAAESRQCPLAAAERAVLGLDHHTAGKRLAEHWGLPHAIQDVIWLHGQAPESIPDLPHRTAISLVTVAKALVRALHVGWCGEPGTPPSVEELGSVHGVDTADLDEITPRVYESLSERCRLLGLEDQSTPELLLASIAEANRRLGFLAGSLGERQRGRRGHERALAAVADFASSPRTSGVGAAVGEVVRSASQLFGTGFFTVIFQARASEPWQAFQTDGEGRLLRSESIAPPRELGPDARALGTLTESGVAMAALGLLPWLADYAGDAADLRAVRVMALTRGDGPAVVLLHDRDLSGESGPALRALAGVWGSAIAAAAAHDGARRLGEQLADANRSLAEAQATLTESQSLLRLGEMTAGAAHEMNNPLTVISGRSQLLAARLRDGNDRADAAAIVEAARDLTDLITNLRVIADPPRPDAQVCSVSGVARDAVELAESRTHRRGRVEVTVAAGVGPGVSDAGMLGAALAELICNALECDPRAKVRVGVQSGAVDDRLLITVEDSGPGMSARALRHAFDPFFSEKPAGRQRGLGLTRARRLVERLGGGIALRSSPGQGTTATITLPGWRSGSARDEPVPAAA